MRRSDMVLAIMECLVEPHFPDDPEKEAAYILKKLEKKGMKPPLTKRCPVLLTTINYWEPEEDET